MLQTINARFHNKEQEVSSSLSSLSSEQQLWQAVLLQALSDSVLIKDSANSSHGLRNVQAKIKHRATQKRMARAWFNLSSPNFVDVCTLAGYHPQVVISKARELWANPAAYKFFVHPAVAHMVKP